MNLADRRRLGERRLAALGLTVPLPDRSPGGVVAALGALQAQDLASGLWSLGVRTGGGLAEVLDALETGAVVRTWPMRGTLHWVPGRDAAWMCALLAAPAIRAAMRVYAAVGVTDEVIARAGEVFASVLAGGRRLGRAELLAELARRGIDVSGQRGYYLLVRHSQLGLLAQGPVRATGGPLEPTFGLLGELVPDPARPGTDEAMALLVERYVRSHGPVTERDVARWCDQPLRAVRVGIAGTDGRVRSETVGETAYLVHVDAPEPVRQPGALLAPGFDEWLLGYGDRRAQLTAEQERWVVPGGNGMFRGTVVAGSLVVGSWRRRAARPATATRPEGIEVATFEPLPPHTRRAVERAVAAYGEFWSRPVRVEWAEGVGGSDPQAAGRG